MVWTATFQSKLNLQRSANWALTLAVWTQSLIQFDFLFRFSLKRLIIYTFMILPRPRCFKPLFCRLIVASDTDGPCMGVTGYVLEHSAATFLLKLANSYWGTFLCITSLIFFKFQSLKWSYVRLGPNCMPFLNESQPKKPWKHLCKHYHALYVTSLSFLLKFLKCVVIVFVK